MNNLDDIHKKVSKMFWQQILSMWPMLLIGFVCLFVFAFSAIQLLLYILDTYVGKA